MRVPKYREDIKGHVRAIKSECVDLMAGEIKHTDCFIMCWDDCTLAVQEYTQYLTDAELAACFKLAIAR
jgi:hypothetical protein